MASDTNKPTLNGASDLTALGLRKTELVRLLIQSMQDLGYSASAASLERESGITALSPAMHLLRTSVLSGAWSSAESALSSTTFASAADARAARFVIYKQHFLELLDAGHVSEALVCLRVKLAATGDAHQLHPLPLLCMCASAEVRRRARWAGTGAVSRRGVLRALQAFLPPEDLLAERRLEVLLAQAVDGQKERALYPYTRQRTVSLLEDLEHCPRRVPRKPLFRLGGHRDEVWFVQFSHDGRFLASASKDCSVIVWDWVALKEGAVDEVGAIKYRLEGHTEVICLTSWSPDDRHLLSCGKDKVVRLWDMATGHCLRQFVQHTDQVTCCVWLSDGKKFISGGLDRRIYEWDAWSGSTSSSNSYLPSARVSDMAVTRNGKWLVVCCTDNYIRVFDTETKAELARMHESVPIISLSLSMDDRYVLVNTSATDVKGPEIHIWDLVEEKQVKRLNGFHQKRYVIRACFGGFTQAPNSEAQEEWRALSPAPPAPPPLLVLCGSEDNMVYMWQRHDDNVFARLEGHSSTVTSVTWCPLDPNVFASGSDDGTVIIWGVRDRDGAPSSGSSSSCDERW